MSIAPSLECSVGNKDIESFYIPYRISSYSLLTPSKQSKPQVTLEGLYSGQTKKMAITRQVVDKEKGVKDCAEPNDLCR